MRSGIAERPTKVEDDTLVLVDDLELLASEGEDLGLLDVLEDGIGGALLLEDAEGKVLELLERVGLVDGESECCGLHRLEHGCGLLLQDLLSLLLGGGLLLLCVGLERKKKC